MTEENCDFIDLGLDAAEEQYECLFKFPKEMTNGKEKKEIFEKAHPDKVFQGFKILSGTTFRKVFYTLKDEKEERYIIRVGSYGTYFYDRKKNYNLELNDVLELLNSIENDDY